MTNNQHIILAAIMGTILASLLLYIGWDGDGFYLRQLTLVLAGVVITLVAGLVIHSGEE
jgi:ABC-type Fe3+-siderophore transport system permease subunit